MKKRSAQHGMFVIDRVFDASPEQVFRAWADPQAKARWFNPPSAEADKREFDFQAGGREQFSARLPDGRRFGYDSRYQEIVPGERIVYAYTVDIDETRISASLVTIEITPADEGTRLVNTEQGVYLDGTDTVGERERGTLAMYDKLGAVFSK